jgi:hypothetical protein
MNDLQSKIAFEADTEHVDSPVQSQEAKSSTKVSRYHSKITRHSKIKPLVAKHVTIW